MTAIGAGKPVFTMEGRTRIHVKKPIIDVPASLHKRSNGSGNTCQIDLIGSKPIDVIDSRAALTVMEPIWLAIPDAARKIRAADRHGLRLRAHQGDDSKAGVIALSSQGLPRQTRLVQHRQAMPYNEVPTFLAKLMALLPSVGRDAAKLTVLTATRSGKVRNAVWGEFDIDRGIWSIPAARMKMKEAHVVPLSAPASALLRRCFGAFMRNNSCSTER